MASINNEPNGRRTIQFVGADGKRRSIRLGKVSRRQAESVKVKVEDLAAACITGHAPRRETAQWLSDLDNRLHDRLSAVGLVERRTRTTLAAFIDGYIAERTDVKDSTLDQNVRADSVSNLEGDWHRPIEPIAVHPRRSRAVDGFT